MSGSLISAAIGLLKAGGQFKLVRKTSDQNDLVVRAYTGETLDKLEPGSLAFASQRWAQAQDLCKGQNRAQDGAYISDPAHLAELAFLPNDVALLVQLLKLAQCAPVGLLRPVQNNEENLPAFDGKTLLGALAQIDALSLIYKGQAAIGMNWLEATSRNHKTLPGQVLLYTDPVDGAKEHLVAVLGDLDLMQNGDTPPLLRVHSKCATGDLFGSQRCDCGAQLALAKETIYKDGFGLLIYLDQEGRGIGLANKLSAYGLQDQGYDTFQANHQLGFEDDERRFDLVGQILEHLKIRKVKLLTNNPSKVSGLAGGVEVVERLPLQIPDVPERQAYMDAKKKSGHWL